MALYSDIQSAIFSWTKRPDLTAETDIAIRQALRKAHRAGNFILDMSTVPLTAWTVGPLTQYADLSFIPNLRQIVTVQETGTDRYFEYANPRELLDLDGLPKTDIWWQIGQLFNMRAIGVTSLDLTILSMPDYTDLSALTGWMPSKHQDLIVLWAAATVFSTINEDEIKTRVEALAKFAYEDLISEALEGIGR